MTLLEGPVRTPEHLERQFTRLYDQHQSAVARYLRELVRNADLADDLTQDTFAKAWTALPRFRPDNEVGWLMKIAYRVAIDDLRRRALRRRWEADYEPLAADQHPAAAAAEDPAKDALLGERRRQIATTLTQLPVRYAQSLVLAEYHDLSNPEIARRLGCSRAVVKCLLFRARSAFALRWPTVSGEALPAGTPLRDRARARWHSPTPGVYRRPEGGLVRPWVVQPYDRIRKKTVWIGTYATEATAMEALTTWQQRERDRRAGAAPAPARTEGAAA